MSISSKQSTLTERVWDSTWNSACCTHPPQTGSPTKDTSPTAKQPYNTQPAPQATNTTGHRPTSTQFHRQPFLQATDSQAKSPTGNEATSNQS